jgi:hypothetical protein
MKTLALVLTIALVPSLAHADPLHLTPPSLRAQKQGRGLRIAGGVLLGVAGLAAGGAAASWTLAGREPSMPCREFLGCPNTNPRLDTEVNAAVATTVVGLATLTAGIVLLSVSY